MKCSIFDSSWWAGLWNNCGDSNQTYYRDDDDLSKSSIFSTDDYFSCHHTNDWTSTSSSIWEDNTSYGWSSSNDCSTFRSSWDD